MSNLVEQVRSALDDDPYAEKLDRTEIILKLVEALEKSQKIRKEPMQGIPGEDSHTTFVRSMKRIFEIQDEAIEDLKRELGIKDEEK